MLYQVGLCYYTVNTYNDVVNFNSEFKTFLSTIDIKITKIITDFFYYLPNEKHCTNTFGQVFIST